MTYITHKCTSLTVLQISALRVAVGTLGCWLWICGSAMAQLCGDLPVQPVVYETFGSGTQRPSLTSQTSYEYKDGNCPNDGQYTITSFVDGTCFDSVWHAFSGDHTTGTGNFMLVNAGYDGGVFYQQPVSGLCTEIRYEFSLWAINLIKPDQAAAANVPTLTARVETPTGELIQTIDLGSVPVMNTPVWTRFGGTFTVPDNVNQLVIYLINQKGGSGNDLAIDDIQIKQCSLCGTYPFYAPDAFTPNNDGVNDEFEVFLRDPKEFELKIYNRWGSLIFTSSTPASKWNGTFANLPCSSGEYTWVVSYQSANQPGASSKQVKTGHVMLLR